MTSNVEDTPVKQSWVELQIQASLKDYVTREVHDRDFKELREEDKAIRKDFATADEKTSKTAGEAKTIAASKVGWRIYAGFQAAIICGLLAVIWSVFAKSIG